MKIIIIIFTSFHFIPMTVAVELRPLMGLLSIPWAIDEWMCMVE
jgi:hypothetical protein